MNKDWVNQFFCQQKNNINSGFACEKNRTHIQQIV